VAAHQANSPTAKSIPARPGRRVACPVEAEPTLIPVPPVARAVTAQVAETAEEAKRENLLMVRSIHLRLGRRVGAL
ncbi:hypothetical protein LTR46_011554, partial [Exophiala xenobiotica]